MSTLTKKFESRRNFSLGDNENMVVRLILINIVVFVGLSFAKVVYQITEAPVQRFFGEVLPWVVMPAGLQSLLTHPWTVISFMFVHLSFWNLLSTVIWLWWFGGILQSLAGQDKVVPLYLYGGWAGALFFLLVYNLFPPMQGMRAVATTINIGAAASVISIIVATTILVPNYRVFPMLGGGIPLYVITIIYVVLDFIGHRGTLPVGYLAAQGGGAIAGYLYISQLQKGRDTGRGLNRLLYRIGHVFDPPDRHPRRGSIKEQFFYKKELPPYRKVEDLTTQKVDEILDKINATGYDSLSEEEKGILRRASEETDE